MSNKNKPKADILTENDTLKAVIVADSFDDKFGPLSATKPKVRISSETGPPREATLLVTYCCKAN